MSRANFQSRMQGHRVDGPGNQDLNQKLSYQQLLNLNHDLSKQNHSLKSIGNRLGKELQNLHSQFDIHPREENAELYRAIGTHPTLHHYQNTLIPLLDSYQQKIQDFQHGFETINQEFTNLEKRFEEIALENQQLKLQLTEKIKQIIDLYKNGAAENLHSDFGHIIMQQINEKQKVLVKQNGQLERDYQRFKSEAERSKKQLVDFKARDAEAKGTIKEYHIKNQQLEAELKSLKENVFRFQIRINELENEKKKVENDLQRGMSQVNQLNRERDNLQKNYDGFKIKYERDLNEINASDQSKLIEDLKSQIQTLQNKDSFPDDSHKKLIKIQKDLDNIVKEKAQFKDQCQSQSLKIQDLNQRIVNIKKKTETLESEKNTIEISQAKLKKIVEQLAEKSKQEILRQKKRNEDSMESIEKEWSDKFEKMQRKIVEMEEALDQVKLERDKLEKENLIYSSSTKENLKTNKLKDTDKAIDKLKEKLNINEELYKQQLQIIQNDNSYLKKEADSYKNEVKQKGEDLRKTRQDFDKCQKQLTHITEQKAILIEEIRRVRNEYEGNLKDKERLFDQKIREIKTVVDESDKRRKAEREKVAEASREYKRVLEEIKSTYEERIRVLEVDGTYEKGKRIDNYS